jgi:hypothetical protein
VEPSIVTGFAANPTRLVWVNPASTARCLWCLWDKRLRNRSDFVSKSLKLRVKLVALRKQTLDCLVALPVNFIKKLKDVHVWSCSRGSRHWLCLPSPDWLLFQLRLSTFHSDMIAR